MAGLLLQDKNPGAASSTAAEARARGVAAAECDVTDIVDIRRCVDAAVGEFGRRPAGGLDAPHRSGG